ncbi:MAG: CTP synthase [Clostridium sp.]|nr:CTP synthase [Clostridium sp.]
MDEMRIVSKFTTGMISKLLKLALRKKLGYDIDVRLNEVTAKVDNGKTHIHLDVDAELEKDELTKILKSVGL